MLSFCYSWYATAVEFGVLTTCEDGRWIPMLKHLAENTIINIYLYSHLKITSVLFVTCRH